MEFLAEYGMFLLKTLTFVGAAVVIIAVGGANAMKDRNDKGHIEVSCLNDELKQQKAAIQSAILSEEEIKSLKKEKKAKQKQDKKAAKKKAKESEKEETARVYVLDFHGDMQANAADKLSQEVTAVLSMAKPQDEVVIRLESPGGVVHGYGYAASQLHRIRDKDIPLTVCVDKVAASGGYMMACLANKIVAAPFSIIGSIGVLAQVPNIHRLLKKNDIDFELHTAGEYKRTLTMLGENTDEGREKFREELHNTHELFKKHVSQSRPALEISKVATGEVWYGSEAKDMSLVDEIGTSEQYLMDLADEKSVYEVQYAVKRSLQSRLGLAASAALSQSVDNIFQKLWLNRFQ